MRVTSANVWQISLLLTAVFLAALLTGCKPQPLPELPVKKVIVTNLGEVTKEVRYVGETIRYKIYFANKTKQKADVGIVDHLDPNLGKVVPLNKGFYDRTNHLVAWKIEKVPPGGGSFVEFEAVISGGTVIRDQALLQIGVPFDPEAVDPAGRDVIKTNIVETLVRPDPMLGWIPFDRESAEGALPSAALKEETTLGTLVRFDIPGMYAQKVELDGTTFHRLAIPRHTALLDIGKPELPIVGQIIEIPKDVNFTLEIVQSKSRKLDHYNVYPAQEPTDWTGTGVPKQFVQDAVTYTTDAIYPASLAMVEAHDVGIIRGHRVMFLKANPVQCNPVTRETMGYSMIEVRVNFDRPAQIERAPSRLESAAFEQMIKASVLNYKEPQRLTPIGHHSEEGVDYLILTDGSFYTAGDANNPLNRLAAWKRQKGLTTRIVDVANIPGGNTAANIIDYLQGAYTKWYPVPTYVLLVGDSEFIPTNYQTNHPTSHNSTQIGTDLYYTTLDGTDYFPDIFLGRLSIDTMGELSDVVNKILDYEKSPPVNANFYEDNALVCLFEDDTDILPPGTPPDSSPEDGQEDDGFPIIEFAEEIFDHLDGPDYDPERIYDESAVATNPQQYVNGTNLPVNLTVAGGFVWNGATADITNAINNGVILVTFAGHGNRNGWSRPAFDNNNVNALGNLAQTPVVFSLTCQSGWFDNETDAPDLSPDPGIQGTGANDESFSEAFLRHNSGGAVAFIGSTRNSWEPNVFLMLGLYKALWPDFDPAPPFAGQFPDIETGALYRIGQVNTFSKVYMANYYTDDIYRQSTFELYHLLGDPEMGVWTDEPGRLDVDHPPGIGATGTQDFIVRVSDDASDIPVRSATVVLTRGDDILGVIQTNPAGIARFTLNALGPDTVNVTVTARNYRPYEGTMTVTTSGGELNRLDPTNGPVSQTIHVGGLNFSDNETVDLTFGSEAPVSTNAAAGSFGHVGTTDVDLQVPATHPLGPVNVLAHGQSSNRYGVDVFQVRSANPIDLYTYDQWDSSTWHLHAGDNPTWNNPEIQLYDSTGNPVESNNLTAGHTYTIKAKVHNDTDFRANSVTVTFKWANFGVGQSERDWQEIDVDTLDLPAHRIEEAEVSWAPPSTGHLCVMAEIYHIEDINEDNNEGQENCHVGPTSSPAKVPFLVGNPTEYPGYVHLELRQIRTTSEQKDLLWESWIQQPDPQLLSPGDKREAWVIIDPGKADIRTGDEAEFALTGSMGGKVIGGVNFIIMKK
jgi:hypothetical protein